MNEEPILRALGDIPTDCLGGLLAHIARIHNIPHSLYADIDANISGYSERFSLDAKLLRGVIKGDCGPNDKLLRHFNLKLITTSDVCPTCGHIHDDFIYRYNRD